MSKVKSRMKHKVHFSNVRSLAKYIESGGAVVHSKTRAVYYSLRELPPDTEQQLPQLKKYTEAEIRKDFIRRERERKIERTNADLDMSTLFKEEIWEDM